MKHLKLKLTAVMVGTTVVIILFAILTINFLSQRLIFDQVYNELEQEANYYKNFDINYTYEGKRLFEISSFNLDDYDYYEDIVEDEYSDALNYFTAKERLFYNQYLKGVLRENQIVRINDASNDFFAMLIRVDKNSPYMMNIARESIESSDFNTAVSVAGKMPPDENLASAQVEESIKPLEKNSDTTDNVEDEALSSSADKGRLIVLYTDVSITTNIVSLLNMIFLVLLITAIIVEGFIGILMGSKLENSQKKMRYFFQNASHELKSPLMSVQGYAEGIQQGVITDVKSASQIIIKKSERMRKLIDEMLMLSKLDSNAYIFNSRKIDIRNIIDDSVDNFDMLAEQKSLQVNLDYENTDAVVLGDDLQLYKAFNTVIDNAFKFAESKVCIQSLIKGKVLRTTIYNDGTPIDAVDLEHIFDRFYSGNHISTGIGLAMAKEIVKQSGGQLTAMNSSSGVTFTIDLPLVRKGNK